MKKYKKVDDKIFVEETIEKEVKIDSFVFREDALNTAISRIDSEIDKLQKQKTNYENELKEVKNDIKAIDKL